MNNFRDKLVSWLFETEALRVCPQDKPFWYTSGAIGPYYINTHFLYGSEEKANNLLKLIDEVKKDIIGCPGKILDKVLENYNNDKIFKELIDEMVNFIRQNQELQSCDYISGGERRDWFFSIIIAHILNKPHITIYKDLKAVLTDGGKVVTDFDIKDKKVLHIVDLINEASSYERAWIPAIKSLGGEIIWSMAVVDRMQGGSEFLESNNIKPFSMINIDKDLFKMALDSNYINKSQFDMIAAYLDNPKEAMTRFLNENPQFMKNALEGDEKTRERAKLCLDKGIYDLKG
ncbi:MAG TPA: orotate phosphoribosyltransferase [Pseudobacteroides sp.]|uniref:orotate phosphoribosyltransferase n=1 Tax=Pseudobacteroides sp. TaxID=1968840 RepID=UPI002F9448BC